MRLGLFAGARLRPLATAHLTGAAGRDVDVAAWVRDHVGRQPSAIAHRVVHGGGRYAQAQWLNKEVEAEIDRLSILAPLHNPPALRWIRRLRTSYGARTPQLAVFDTAFYADLPPAASRYALPGFDLPDPVRRYGFHGLAHRSMLQQLQELTATEARPDEAGPARIISLQLGAGCSISASVDGRCVDTSMGFTPLEGLVMATRSGDVDPGLLFYLQRELGYTPEALEKLLNEQSGLLGLSGESGDLRVLLASERPEARLAVDVYCHRLRKYLGACLAVLGGADTILFGGGVGEHSPLIRARALETLVFAGIKLDPEKNANQRDGEAFPIHHADSAAAIWVIPVNEASIMAGDALALLQERNP